MRWLFPHPAEASARAAVVARIDAFWAAFVAKTGALEALFAGRAKWDLAAWMQVHLGVVDPRLMWEFGPGLAGGHRLVITPESDHALRPLLDTLLARAPRIEGWELYPYRLAEPYESAVASVEARVGVSVRDVRVVAELDELGRVDPTFLVPPSLGDVADDAAFVAAESWLGERTLNTWVGAIDATTGAGGAPLAELRACVQSRIAEWRASRDPRPWHAAGRLEAAESTLFELKPRPGAEHERFDLKIASTMDLPMWKAAHGDGVFASERYSGAGETFAYLKIDGLGVSAPDVLARRTAVEDALDAALVPAGLGAVVGGGTGLRYGYLDLALANLTTAVDAVRAAAGRCGVGKRTWLLFFDPSMADEWVGVWDDTPPPPRAAS